MFSGVEESIAKEAILQLGNLGTMAKDLKLQPLPRQGCTYFIEDCPNTSFALTITAMSDCINQKKIPRKDVFGAPTSLFVWFSDISS